MNMYKSGLLILPGPFNQSYKTISQYLKAACKHVNETLYVQLHSQMPPVDESIPLSYDIKDMVINTYSCAASVCNHVDVKVILSNIGSYMAKRKILKNCDFDIILHDNAKFTERIVDYVKSTTEGSYSSRNVKIIDPDEDVSLPEPTDCSNSGLCKTFKHIVLGGTFDRLHAGHKVMLSKALLICDDKITIGVTCGPMNANKVLVELMESSEQRIESLKKFISEVKPNIDMNIVPITDPYGPSIVVPDMDCIVVSEETARGGLSVNKKRIENNLKPLEIVEIDLVEDKLRSPEEEKKISSSSLRKRLLATLWKTTESKSHLVPVPFVIGLTGGIASGKSSICRKLEELGAGIVDCDKLGHQVYKKGSNTLKKVVEAFGEDILDENGEINRRVLGGKVFSNKDDLNKLNSLVWPAIANAARKEINDYAIQRKKVIILDAAVLLAAGWDNMVHEVWVCIIPKKEAVKRIMNRNKLSEEESLKRIESQKSNSEQIVHANVILSTLWETSVTEKQVEKAWDLLLQRMPPSTH